MNTDLWKAAIEGALTAIWVIDELDLRILIANSAAEQLLQVAPGHFNGKPVGDLAATPEDVFFWEDVQAGVATQIHSETLLRRADGGSVPVERRVSRIKLPEGGAIFILVARDLSEQRHVEDELERLIAELRATLESTADGILVTDLNGRIRSYNQRFAEFWAVAEDLQLRRNDSEVFAWMARSVVDVETYEKRLAEILQTSLLETADVIYLRSGRILERVSLPQYARGRPIGRVYCFRDVTERKQAEKLGQFRSRTLELLTGDTTIPDILEAIVRGIEHLDPEMLCSILLLDGEGPHLKIGAAPSLPDFYNSAIDGLEIGIGVGSCGTAAYTGQRVIVESIATHPYWTHYKELAASAGLQACWSQPICSSVGKVLGTFAIYHRKPHSPSKGDIALIEQSAHLVSIAIERRQAGEALRIAATAFESQEGITITDANGVILRVNKAFSEITGYSEGEAIGQNPRLLNSGRQSPDFYAAMWDNITRLGSWQGEIWNRRKDGEIYPEWLTVTAVKDDAGNVTHYVGIFADITTRKTAEDAITHLAFYDHLTELPNRRLMLDRLGQALTSSARHGWQGALMLIDLDNFKALNDTLGHAVGDQLLTEAASRLESSIREGDTVARLGGDEFVVILEDLDEAEQAAVQTEAVATKIQERLSQPYILDLAMHGDEPTKHSHHCTSSIGITLFRGHSITPDELMKRADTAMYHSKAAGRNTHRFFDPHMQAEVDARAAMELELRKAIVEGQFVLYYQAQVDVAGRCLGAEVLVRWHHPEQGLVSPAKFIPLAEETGLIVPLGHWVLQDACKRLAAWKTMPEMAHLSLAVNLSARQISLPNIVEEILALIEHTGAPPDKLKLELTESLLLDNTEDIIAKMLKLQANGIRFSLDDFGTGYSSLSYLKRLPLDQLKIDQSFVCDVLSNPNDAAIAKTIIALAKSLGLSVIAEGVETKEQQSFLADSGCHAYQGYLFCRPLPAEGFEKFVLWGSA